MSKISKITPIKDAMNKEQLAAAMAPFLSKILHHENILKQSDIMTQESKICGVRHYNLLTLKDGSTWVQGTGGIERLIGANYLSDQLEELQLDNKLANKWAAVETKVFLTSETNSTIKLKIKSSNNYKAPLKNILTIDSNDVISCSKYVGDDKPMYNPFDSTLFQDKSNIQKFTGFTDFTLNANLRKQSDGTIVIIDTEYGSFSSDGYEPLSVPTEVDLGGYEFIYDMTGYLQ